MKYNPDKKYLIYFDAQVGHSSTFDCRIIGLLEGKYADDDCPSGKVYCVTYADPLCDTIHSVWVSKDDNPVLIEITEDEWELYKIFLKEE